MELAEEIWLQALLGVSPHWAPTCFSLSTKWAPQAPKENSPDLAFMAQWFMLLLTVVLHAKHILNYLCITHIKSILWKLWAYLRYTTGQFQTTTIKCHNKASGNLFAGGRSCLPFVRKATSVKGTKTWHVLLRGFCGPQLLSRSWPAAGMWGLPRVVGEGVDSHFLQYMGTRARTMRAPLTKRGKTMGRVLTTTEPSRGIME